MTIKFCPKLWTLTVHDVVCVHASPSSLVQKKWPPKAAFQGPKRIKLHEKVHVK